MYGISTAAIIVIVVAILIVLKGIVIVHQGYEYTIERLGRFVRSMRPGFHIIIPFIDAIGAKVNMMERVLEVPSQEVITKDNAVVRVDGIMFFQVLDAAKASYEVNDLEHASLNLTMTNIRTVLGSMDLDESLSKRDEINAALLHVVDAATSPWGIKVTRIEIKDISPPSDLVDSMARQMKAERDKRAAILEAEGLRQSEILRAEGQKRALILDAEGEKEAAFRQAEARERLAQAEAEATRVVSEAIAVGDIQAVNYFVAIKYVEALQTIGTADNQKIMFLPTEVSSLIGSIGGISELVKETFKSKSDNNKS
ncbi:SPFH domain-containing protein [Candidatus Spongiihabitans sp.]|uniref:SPFH domain-containing protein n=1 Tax=Candidatus Spongiihabitans sp. TaxID=3101308 RepID=UPI003C6ED9F6